MENIYEATSDFPFDKLTIIKPTAITGGNYFMKFRIQDSPLYIQSPKCLLKQGISKAGKRFYTDLMFSNEHEQFTQWIEHLENFSQKYIYEQRTQWFETDLDMHDIENSFSPSLKLYKSGKYYLARAIVPSVLGKCSLKIYDEKENEIDYQQLTENMNVITILEILGIKCSARSFQIEIEIKQMLVLKPTNIFDRCILVKTPTYQPEVSDLGNVIPEINEHPAEEFSEIENPKNKPAEETFSEIESPKNKPAEETFSEIENQEYPIEVDFHVDELPESESIHLKTRNDVYYKMYRDAKRKAKIARDLALSSYLEAKQIKNQYMLNEIDDSDSYLEEEEEQFEESMHNESDI